MKAPTNTKNTSGAVNRMALVVLLFLLIAVIWTSQPRQQTLLQAIGDVNGNGTAGSNHQLVSLTTDGAPIPDATVAEVLLLGTTFTDPTADTSSASPSSSSEDPLDPAVTPSPQLDDLEVLESTSSAPSSNVKQEDDDHIAFDKWPRATTKSVTRVPRVPLQSPRTASRRTGIRRDTQHGERTAPPRSATPNDLPDEIAQVLPKRPSPTRAPRPQDNGQQRGRPHTQPGAPPKRVVTPPPSPEYIGIVYTTCQCKQPFIEQYEAMYKEGLANLAATPEVTPEPTTSELPTPEPTTQEPTTMEPTSQPQENYSDADEQPSTQPGKVALTKWRRGTKSAKPMPNTRTQLRQPYNQGDRAKRTAASPPAAFLPFWKPGFYGHSGSLRRFLKQWYREVMDHREKTLAGDAPSSPPPEARILLIGDSLSRNLHFSLINQALDEGLGPEDEPYSAFTRQVIHKGGDAYRSTYVTWPGSTGNVKHNGGATSEHNFTATIKIRYETQTYFGMDTHSIKSSRGLEFNPTHLFIGRGMWDVIHGRPRDPSIALSGLSAGLVRLRKELSEYREGLTPEERKLYPPTRVVYWGLPKMFQSWEPGAKAQHCGFDQEQNYFRDALYAAVRRANGALQHMHSKERFDSVAIELFDYYAISMAAGAVNTNGGDCIHPSQTSRLVIISQMLDLVSQPPRSQESVQQLIDDAQANNRVFLNATMNIPPPLVVRETDELSNTTCPLSFTLDDVDRILHPPKLVGVGAAAALSEDVEDLTPPPLQSIPTSTGKELFFSMMRCQVTDNMNWGTVRPVELARIALETAMSTGSAAAATSGTPDVNEHTLQQTTSTPDHQHVQSSFEIDQRRSDYVSACSAMLFSALMSHGSTMPFYTRARRVPMRLAKSGKFGGRELLWAGNRCLQFINREAAELGPTSFFQQLWGYTERHRMICAVPPLVSGMLRQPVHQSLSGAHHGGDELARCAMKGRGLGLRMNGGSSK